MKLEDVLTYLVESSGVSGYEHTVSKIIETSFKDLCDDIRKDRLGNVIGYKKGFSHHPIKIMLAAHMDEIGLMVKDIDKNGFIKITNVGGVDQRILLAQEVIVHGKKDIFGVIGAKPPHLQSVEERNEAIKMEDLLVDVGLSKSEAEEFITIGDTITIPQKMNKLQNDMASSKAMDDRAGIATIIECLIELSKMKHASDIYVVATVQEEVGTRGAMVSTYQVEPDIGIAIDVGFGATPELSKDEVMELGKGPGIGLGGNIHPKIHQQFVKIAKEYNLPYQIELSPGMSGTDAQSMQISQSGVATGVISIPLRYMHTTVETVDMKDIKNAGKLLAAFISSLNDEDLEGLLCF